MTQYDQVPYSSVNDVYTSIVENNARPTFDDDSTLLNWMQKLIEKSWSKEPWLRPTTRSLLGTRSIS